MFARWRTNFITGLVLLMPAVITLVVVKWLYGIVAGLTDGLLFFLPREWIRAGNGQGELHWYFSLAALMVAIVLVSLFGLLARYYIGKRVVAWIDATMLRLPLLNKIYGTVKQVNQAFSASKATAFKTVVLVPFPREGLYSIGFITGEQHGEVQHKTRENVVSVFVPTTPNPTTGFLVLTPEDKLVRLDMSVADAIKSIISLGSVMPAAPAAASLAAGDAGGASGAATPATPAGAGPTTAL